MLSRTSEIPESILGKRKRGYTLDYYEVLACKTARNAALQSIVRAAGQVLTLLNQTDCRIRLLSSDKFFDSFTGMICNMRTVLGMNQDTVDFLEHVYRLLQTVMHKPNKTQEDWKEWFQGVHNLIGCLTYIVETY